MSGTQPMARVEIRYVNEYQSNGKTFRYYRRNGKRVRLHAAPGTPEFAQELAAAEALALGLQAPAPAPGIAPGSLRALFAAYAESPQYKRLAPATKAEYRRAIEALYPKYGHMRVSTLPSTWVQRRQDELADTPRKANRLVAVLRLLLNWGAKRGWIDGANPTSAVDLLPTGPGHRRWTDTEFAAMAGPQAVEIALPVLLAYYTAQRLGDVLALRWEQYDGATITLRQQKTGTPLAITAHPALKRLLDHRKRELREAGQIAPAIATRPDGKAWKPDHYKHRFAAIRAALGLPDDLHFHGLRHSALSALAEAGATEKELQSVGGHKTTSSLARYTAQASQATLNASAMAKLPTRGERRKNTK